MRPALTILAAVLAVVSVSDQLRARDSIEPAAPASASATPAGTLLYLDRSQWRRADRTQKIMLAEDFMRIFCGNPAMPPSILVGCLDDAEDAGSMFEHALICVATDRARISTPR
jgi:hypothetical protein